MKTRTTIRGYFDLSYVILVNVPMRESKFGPVIAVKPEVLERRIAEEIIRQRIPLRGREVTFLRKALGLSFEKFSSQFGRNASTVFHWEKHPDKRLDPLVEAGLRSLFAEQLGIRLAGKFSALRGTQEMPEGMEIQMGKAA